MANFKSRMKDALKSDLVRNAAPELLQAAENALRFVDAYMDEDVVAKSLSNQLILAIKKAKGEA